MHHLEIPGIRQTHSACPKPRPGLGRGAEIMQREQKYTQGVDFVFHIVHKDLYLTQTLAGKVFTP